MKVNLNNTITDVITLVRTKYSHTIDIILHEDILTLEYMYTIADDRDVYQLIQVKEFDDKLSIEFLTKNICKIIDIAELEDIFEMLHRHSTKQKYTSVEIKFIKEKYVKGTKIRLIKMYDLLAPAPETIGTVTSVDDIRSTSSKL